MSSNVSDNDNVWKYYSLLQTAIDEITDDKLMDNLAKQLFNLSNKIKSSIECKRKTKFIRKCLIELSFESEDAKEEVTTFANNLTCVSYEYEQIDYMACANFVYNVVMDSNNSNNNDNNNNILKISTGFNVCDPSGNHVYWSLSVNDIELCEEADPDDINWKILSCNEEDIIECNKLLNFKHILGVDVLHRLMQ